MHQGANRVRVPGQVPNWSVKFAWYDLWIGVFIDATNHVLYICPLPTLLITVQLWVKNCDVHVKEKRCRFEGQAHQHVEKAPWCAYAIPVDDACCPSGTRFARDTGGFPQDHPEECAV